jgi:hypothetical protein
MWKHFRRVAATLTPLILTGGYLLTHSIPETLGQADKSAADIARAVGVAQPWPHMATYVWHHPFLAGLVALALFVLGMGLSWLVEATFRRIRRRTPDGENLKAYGQVAANAYSAIGTAMGHNTGIHYEMALASIEPMLLLLKKAKISIPDVHKDGAKAGVLRTHRYLNVVNAPLAIGDQKAAAARAAEAVPRLNALSENELWRAATEVGQHARPIEDRKELIDCLLFSVFRGWGHSENELGTTDQLFFFNGACRRFEQLARDGVLTIWGQRHRNAGSHEPISAEVWSEQQIERMSVFTGMAETEYLAQGAHEHPLFYRLMARATDVEHLFKEPAK